MKNKVIMFMLSAMLLVPLTACNDDTGAFLSGQGQTPDPVEKEKEKEKPQDQKPKEEEKKKDEKEETQTVKVYFSDNQAMNLIECEIDINLSKDESLEKQVVESLKSQPKDPEMFNALADDIKINSVKVEDKLALVDLSSENLNGSSTQESFLIDSIVASLTSLDTVEKVKFLVDGKEVETLMGHMEVIEAFTKTDIGLNIIRPEK